jgi:hypothetical protein
MKTITLLAAAVFIVNVLFAQTATDKIILQKGQKLQASTTTNGSMSMEMMGQNMETITESSASNTLDVKDVTSSGYILTSKINKLKVKTKGGMAPDTEFDSDKKEDMDTEIGKSIKDKLQPKDIEITFSGRPVEAATKNNAEDMNKVMQSVMSGAGDNGITDVFMLVPSGKKAGDVWTDSSNVNGIRVINTYTLKEIRGKDAVVAVNTLSNINKTMQAQGAELTINMDSKILSDNTIDITTGLIKERKTTVEGKGKLSTAGQEMPMTTKVTAVTTVKSL